MRIVLGGSLMGCAVLISGCTILGQHVTKSAYRGYANGSGNIGTSIGWNDGRAFGLSDLEAKQYDGPLVKEYVTVHYPPGLLDLASAIADHVLGTITYVETVTGVRNRRELEFYLIRVDYLPLEGEILFPKDSTRVRWPIFALSGEESLDSVLSINFVYPHGFIHEIVELALVEPSGDNPILMDLNVVKHHTRWFRDGLACYSQYLLYDMSHSAQRAESTVHVLSPVQRKVILPSPLAALADVGVGLFSWTDFKDSGATGKYYRASLGLFLLIEQRFGREAIRRIVENLDTYDYLNGRALESIIDRTLSVNIVEMVREYRLPDLGVGTMELTPAKATNLNLKTDVGLYVDEVRSGGVSERAGIHVGDVIVSVSGRHTLITLDYEIGLLAAEGREDVVVIVNRFGEELSFLVPISESSSLGLGSPQQRPGP